MNAQGRKGVRWGSAFAASSASPGRLTLARACLVASKQLSGHLALVEKPRRSFELEVEFYPIHVKGEEDMNTVQQSSRSSSGNRIVVGIDGSSSSMEALEWAARQAELTHAPLEVIAAWEWPTSYGWSLIPNGYDPAGDLKNTLEPLLVTLRASHPDVVVSSKIVEGHPAPALINESIGADLLVVGSRGHGEFVGMLIGSTSEHCVANARCPVVVIRSHA
jgi:nucleotide-binding universal stress UspA family protein